MSGALDVERHGAIVVLTINNPRKGNALSRAILDQLTGAAEDLERDRTIRAMILTGSGEKAFCTGADIDAWGDMDPVTFARDWILAGHRLFDRLARVPVPTIGALNGATFGGGLELASVCDLRIAAPSAVFGLPEASIGVTPGWSGTQRLARLLPQALLREMALTSGQLTATRLREVGFLNEVADHPLERSLEIAERTVPLAPRAVESIRLVLNAAAGEGREAAIDALASAVVVATSDKAEGIASFRGKRYPRFRGD